MRALTALIQKKEFDSREKEEDYVEDILNALDGKCLQTSVVSEEIAREAVGEMERKKEIENVINSDAPMAVDEEDGEVGEKEDDDDVDVDDESDDEDRANQERLQNELRDEAIVVCDAFAHAPRYQYDETRNVFAKIDQPATMDAEADSKINVYRERFHLLRQRMSRHESFTKPAFGKKKKVTKMRVRTRITRTS